MAAKIIKKDQVDQDLSLETRLDLKDNADVALGTSKKVIASKDLSEREQAKSIIEKAHQEAEAIKAKAKSIYQQVENKMDEAKRAGFEKGREEGQASVTEELAKVQKQQQDLLTRVEKEAIGLVYEIAQKLIGDALKDSDEAIIGMIRQALQSSMGNELTLFVNPEDFDRVKAHEQKLLGMVQAIQSLHLKASEKVRPGGCIVESELGTIDAEFDLQMEAIKRALGLAQ